jgi:hypothetical protein
VIREAWDGGEWQEHCRHLLAMKYGENVQFVPDRDRGDGGLEAYRLDAGVVYQCYAPQEAYDVASLTEAQKGKIRRDVKKLVDDPGKTSGIIGEGTIIERWVLLTPYYDSKELVIYAREKSAETRKMNPCPPWCHSEFQIVVADDSEFSAQKVLLYGAASVGLELSIPDPTAAEVMSASTGLSSRLLPKLRIDPILSASEEDLARYCDEIILDYIRGGQQLELLESGYTLTANIIGRRARSTLRSLTRISLGTPGSGPEMVASLTDRLASDFRASAPSLSPLLCEELARHFVGAWFIECPLRFAPRAA